VTARDEFFDNLFNETTPAAEDIKALRQLAYEERVIKRVFSECGIRIPSWGRIAIESRNVTGETKINFRWFNSIEAGHNFPAKLCGKRIPHLHSLTLPKLFKPVGQNALVKAVAKTLNFAGLDPDKTKYVCVFPLIKTPFCAHNLTNAGYQNPQNIDHRMQLMARYGATHAHMFIEPLKSFCDALGPDWFTP